GGARVEPRRSLRVRRAARRALATGGRQRPPRRLGVEHGRARVLARPRDLRRRAPDPGDRSLLLPLDLLPRAERGALRDRHAGPRLHRRRAARAPRREALAAAGLRAPARRGRTEPAPCGQPAFVRGKPPPDADTTERD